jgi:hypothetical protein
MKKFKFFKDGFKYKLLCVIVILFCNNLNAQVAPIALKWDKTGCQANLVDQINFDSNFSTATCLKVCQNSMMNYRLIGSNLPNVTNVEWTVTGGEIETNKEFAVINWDDTNSGLIDIKLTFIDNTVVQRTICVEKMESQLILSWDRIGCQNEDNNISEIKYSNISLSNPCLKVCKDTKPTFSLNGDNLANIQTIQWLVTGGVAETPNDFKTNIVWNATNTGYITVRIKYFTGTIVQKSICINKINSSLLLEWEKIDENTVHEVKLVNTEANKESILIYENSVVDYTIKGTNKSTITSVNWEVIGGFTENATGFTVPVIWTDEAVKELIVHINYVDGTTSEEKFAVLSKAAAPGGGTGAYNTIEFEYDNAGNQTRRKFIYLSARPSSNSITQKEKMVAKQEDYIESDIYPEISYYPNPVRSELFIKWTDTAEKDIQTIELYDLSGKLFMTYKNQSSLDANTINFENYPTGIYNIMLLYNSGEIKNLKVVKQ